MNMCEATNTLHFGALGHPSRGQLRQAFTRALERRFPLSVRSKSMKTPKGGRGRLPCGPLAPYPRGNADAPNVDRRFARAVPRRGSRARTELLLGRAVRS